MPEQASTTLGRDRMMGKLKYPLRVLTSASLAAFAAILLLLPATGIPQSDAKKDAGPPFNDNIDDPAEWGKAFPKHYEAYKKTVDMQRTKHGGSEAVPTHADPGRPALGRRALQERRGQGPQGHLAGLRLLRRFPRRARPRLHARGPAAHEAPGGREAAGRVRELPRVDVPCRTRRRATATSPRASRRSTQCPTRRRQSS